MPESPVVIYDISLDQSGGNVTITLPVPEGVGRLQNDHGPALCQGRRRGAPVKIVDGKMQFTVDSFSEFAFFNADEAAASDKDVRVTVNTSKTACLTSQPWATPVWRVPQRSCLWVKQPSCRIPIDDVARQGGYTGVAYLTIDYIAADGIYD